MGSNVSLFAVAWDNYQDFKDKIKGQKVHSEPEPVSKEKEVETQTEENGEFEEIPLD
jgi:hypothetical protein